MNAAITSFTGRYAFLSNFAKSSVYILIGTKWVKCPTVEHGFQASKTLSQDERRKIVAANSPMTAKHLGRGVRRASYWEEVKVIVMLELLRQKFTHVDLARRLRATGDAPLIEGNYWHDNFWGVCSCTSTPEHCGKPGENWLGKLLTRVRKDIR